METIPEREKNIYSLKSYVSVLYAGTYNIFHIIIQEAKFLERNYYEYKKFNYNVKVQWTLQIFLRLA